MLWGKEECLLVVRDLSMSTLTLIRLKYWYLRGKLLMLADRLLQAKCQANVEWRVTTRQLLHHSLKSGGVQTKGAHKKKDKSLTNVVT